MPMAGTPAEYERMALKSIEKAAEDISDTMYHLTRAQIFASLANASANESPASGRSPGRAASGPANGAGDDDGRKLPAVRVS